MTYGRLGPGREFDLIRTLLEQHERIRAGAPPITPGSAATGPSSATESAAIRLGAGDDTAIIDASPLVVSADLSFEDVHFRRDWILPEEIGWRATAAALSDIAAMAATPLGILVTFAAKPEDAPGFATKVMAGVSRVAIAHGTALLGGDVSRSTGPFVIDVIALGHAEEPVRRSGARPGDSIWVTGSLGGAACAVAAWTAGELPDPEARARFAHPLPRIEEARWLAQQGALHALIDLSDGLAGDAGHMAAASDVRIRLELARIPLHPAVHDAPARAAQGEVNIGSGLRLALAGGEDYELCFAAPPSFGKSLVDAFQERFGIALTRVGSVEPGSGVVVVDKDGGTHALALTGYSHL